MTRYSLHWLLVTGHWSLVIRMQLHTSSSTCTGRVALVTGGNKGLGKAMARGLAQAGADVFIASRNEAD